MIPRDAHDHGERIGYTVYSLERGRAGFGRADAVRLAFDIFPEYRENRFQRIRFTNHEIYNISRRMLFQLRPRRFLVDARTQISQTRTGRAAERACIYLKRGYYPPDQSYWRIGCCREWCAVNGDRTLRLTDHGPQPVAVLGLSGRPLRQAIQDDRSQRRGGMSWETCWITPSEITTREPHTTLDEWGEARLDLPS